jgi:hypothetical protein
MFRDALAARDQPPQLLDIAQLVARGLPAESRSVNS